MTSKFEQLIEYVINDDTAKAKELFHDIVVEKSRQIYESLMDDESIGGDASDSLIDEVEAEEEGMYEDSEEEEGEEEEEEGEEEEEEGEEEEESGADEEEAGEDEEADGDLEDRVVDLEDKLDDLMAEFEALMGDDADADADTDADSDDMEPVDGDVGGDAYMDDDTAEFTDELSENVDLAPAPKPVTTEPAGTNTKSTYAANSGQAGMAAKPVGGSKAEAEPDGTAAYKQPNNAYSKGEGELPGAGTYKNVPAKDGSKLSPAPKPVTSQAAGVNTKTPFPKA